MPRLVLSLEVLAVSGKKLVVTLLWGFAAVFLAVVVGGVLEFIFEPHSHGSSCYDTPNMELIALAILMYAGDNEGHLPATMGGTFPYVSSGFSYLACCSKTSKPSSGRDVDSGLCGYLYFGAGQMRGKGGESEPIVTTRPEAATKDGYVCVAYRDGHVETHDSVPPRIKALWEAYPNGKPPEVTPPDQSVRFVRSD